MTTGTDPLQQLLGQPAGGQTPFMALQQMSQLLQLGLVHDVLRVFESALSLFESLASIQADLAKLPRG